VSSSVARHTALVRTLHRYGVAAGRVLLSNVRPLSTPLKVTFALTYWCQYRCQTCNIWQRKPVDELTTEEVFRFVDQNRDISWLDLTGGEIFLRKDITEVLARILAQWDRLVLLHFPTNGFLTDTIVSSVAKVARRSPAQLIVTVSIDGDEALNDEIRGVKGGYRRQIETFKALKKIRGVRPVFGMTLSSKNIGAFQRTFSACQREYPALKIEDFHLNVAQISRHYYGNQEVPGVTADSEGARHELKVYRAMRGAPTSIAALVEDTYLRNLDRFLATGSTPMACHSLRSSCFIDPWGTVYPCITYDRPVGRLRDTDMHLAPIWNGADARARQREIWNGDCPQCWTACEAYPTILGNLFPRPRIRPDSRKRPSDEPCSLRPI
jgi:radical SAM protein with 4Fe4S-binding SPASM domain